jgi:parallel beta-helix repeat protein
MKLYIKLRFLVCGILIAATSRIVYAIPMTYVVSNTNDSGPGSLRQALLDSNANNPGIATICTGSSITGICTVITNTTTCNQCLTPTSPACNASELCSSVVLHNTIIFSVAGVISPVTQLPTITHPILLDGYSAPGAHANTHSIHQANNAVITVQLDGPGALFDPTSTAPQIGLRLGVGSDGSVIRGLSITNWAVAYPDLSFGNGIRIDSNNNSIVGNFIGVDFDGVTSLPNFTAIRILGNGNLIGDATPCGRNLLAGHYGLGSKGSSLGVIRNQGNNTIIQGNTIGLDRSGAIAVMPGATCGIASRPSTGVVIGGLDTDQANIIAGHSAANIFVRQSSTMTIQGNYVGTDITGSVVVGQNGIGIYASDPIIDGIPCGITIDSNVISGGGYGITVGENSSSIFALVGTVITNNLIGTDATGAVALPNMLDGIWIKFGQLTSIGGNTISGNGRHGIRLNKSQLALIKGNYIGTNANGDNLGNGSGSAYIAGGEAGVAAGGSGIYLGGQGVGIRSFGDYIGGAPLGSVPYALGAGNNIQFNVGYGIETQGFVEDAQIQGNIIMNNGNGGIYIGKNGSGINAGGFRNAGSVRLMGDAASQQNTVLGSLGTSNQIENNGGNGITVYQANDNELQSNIIESNSGAGIQIIDGSRNLVGSKDPANSAIFAPYLVIPNPLGNQILDNTGGAGVEVIQQNGVAIDNSILTNSIFGNTEGGAPANGISLITE